MKLNVLAKFLPIMANKFVRNTKGNNLRTICVSDYSLKLTPSYTSNNSSQWSRGKTKKQNALAP